MAFLEYYSYEREVHCPLCHSYAILKPTKTGKLVVRCDNCRLLLFANAPLSQEKLVDTVKDFDFERPKRWLDRSLW